MDDIFNSQCFSLRLNKAELRDIIATKIVPIQGDIVSSK
jgi:hypothetical protein